MPSTAEQAFQKYLSKVEGNITNDNIATDRERFVQLFNEAQNKYMEKLLEVRNTDNVRYLQLFLVPDEKISNPVRLNNHFDFPLPEKYFDFSTLKKATASKGKCKNKDLEVTPVKPENLSEFLVDQDNKPSFEWRESIYTLNSDVISVYTDNTFSVEDIYLYYYRYPNQISALSEESFDNSVLIEWDDKSLDRIISICAREFDINQLNQRFQLQELRTNN